MTYKLLMVAAIFGLGASLNGCNKSDKAKTAEVEASKATLPEPSSAAASRVATPPTTAQKVGKTYDGPFGLAKGIPAAELASEFQFKSHDGKGDTYVGTPPRPVPGLGTYFAVATKGEGICKVGAIADVELANGNGTQVKAETDRIAEMVELKYGKFTKKYDFASQDVYTRNPQYWMMGLKEQSVTYSYDWENGKGGLSLPNDIVRIEVDAGAQRTDSGYVRLRYTFSNHKACEQEMKKQKSSNL